MTKSVKFSVVTKRLGGKTNVVVRGGDGGGWSGWNVFTFINKIVLHYKKLYMANEG